MGKRDKDKGNGKVRVRGVQPNPEPDQPEQPARTDHSDGSVTGFCAQDPTPAVGFGSLRLPPNARRVGSTTDPPNLWTALVRVECFAKAATPFG